MIEILNINFNNDNLKKLKYINFYSFVVKTFKTFIQYSKIKKKLFNRRKYNAFQRINRDDEL